MTGKPTHSSSAETRVTRIARYVLVAIFLLSGVSKLIGMESARSMFEDFGYSQDFRIVIGVLETAGAIGLLVPRLAGLAALGLCGIMIGAIVTHLINDPLYMAIFPLVILAVLARIAWQQPLLFTGSDD